MKGDPEFAIGQLWCINARNTDKNSQELRYIYSISNEKVFWSKDGINPVSGSWDFKYSNTNHNYMFIKDPCSKFKSRFEMILEKI